jgi:hypothetical protein
LLKSPARIDEGDGGDAQRFRAGDEIGLVRLEEAQHRGEQARIAEPLAQVLRGRPVSASSRSARLCSDSAQPSAESARASGSFVSGIVIA